MANDQDNQGKADDFDKQFQDSQERNTNPPLPPTQPGPGTDAHGNQPGK